MWKTANGSANASALKNVTVDRNVYAAFTATVRKYTVRFYNENTLLLTVNNVPYGSSATYTGATPVKPNVDNPEKYPFERWDPAPTSITGNTDCYAVFTSPVEVKEITDDWYTIIANINNGTYAQKYKPGNYKPLDFGSEGIVNMQLVAMDLDTLADGSGKAATTWVGITLLPTPISMNPSYVSGKEGTGSVGGWEKMALRSYLANTIMPKIPENVRSSIKPVQKSFMSIDASGSKTEAVCSDTLWIPSVREVCFDYHRWATAEQSGPRYYDVFYDAENLPKLNVDHMNFYYLRSAYSLREFYAVPPEVTGNGYNPFCDVNPSQMGYDYRPRIVPCFCI